VRPRLRRNSLKDTAQPRCAAACPVYLPLSFVSLAAGFMALIVRIVKNVFERAIVMKDELDLTV
jgi:hypothetical protein